MKLLVTALATASLLTGISVRPVQAAPAWAQITAYMACHFLEIGYTPKRASRVAVEEILKTDYAGATIRAYNSGTMEAALTKALSEACPDAINRAYGRTLI